MRQKFAQNLGISAIGHLFLGIVLVLFFFLSSKPIPNLTASPVWIFLEENSQALGLRKNQPAKASISSDDLESNKETAEVGNEGDAASRENLITYQNRIRAILEKKIRYPEIAKRLRQEGEVVLAMEVERSGKVLWSKLQSPSAFSTLNDSALESVSKIERFPPLPEGKASMILEIPLIFALQNLPKTSATEAN
jgi:TonB family protein